ncbi:hypothetical protein DV515_00004909, partial [Chloebia gouldiae]
GWLGLPCRQSADSAPQPRVSLAFSRTSESQGGVLLPLSSFLRSDLFRDQSVIQSMCSAYSWKGRLVVMDLSSLSDCDSACEDKLSCSSYALPSVVVVLLSLSWPLSLNADTLSKHSPPALKVGAAFACWFWKWFVAFGSTAEGGLEGMMNSVQALLAWLLDLVQNKGYRSSQGGVCGTCQNEKVIIRVWLGIPAAGAFRSQHSALLKPEEEGGEAQPDQTGDLSITDSKSQSSQRRVSELSCFQLVFLEPEPSLAAGDGHNMTRSAVFAYDGKKEIPLHLFRAVMSAVFPCFIHMFSGQKQKNHLLSVKGIVEAVPQTAVK